MKLHFLFRSYRSVAVCIFALLGFLPASAENWTVNGKDYHNVVVTKVEADIVSIRYDGGIGRVAIADLSPDLQKRFNFDPSKAKLAAHEREADQEAAAGAQAKVDDANVTAKVQLASVQVIAEKNQRHYYGTVIQVLNISADTKGYLVAIKQPSYSFDRTDMVESGEIILVVGAPQDYVDNDTAYGDVYYGGTTTYASALGVEKTVRVYSPDEGLAVRALLKSSK